MVIFFEEKVVDAKIAIKKRKSLKGFGKQTILEKDSYPCSSVIVITVGEQLSICKVSICSSNN